MEETSDDEMITNERSWSKLKSSAFTQGYPEGLEAGRQARLQEGFDAGFKSGYQQCQSKAVLKGLVTSLLLKELKNSTLCEKLRQFLKEIDD